MTVNTSGNVTIVKARSGKPSLKAICEDGKARTIHSMYDPEAEAKTIVDNFSFDGRGILVVLGLGLGYHVKELTLRYPGTDIIVVESEPEIYKLAVEHGPELMQTHVITAILP